MVDVFISAVNSLAAKVDPSLMSQAMENKAINAGVGLLTGSGAASKMMLSASVQDPTKEPMTKLVGVVLNIFMALGIVLIAFGIFNFVTSLDSHDNAQKIRAGLMIGGGALLIAIKVFIPYLVPSASEYIQ